MVWLLGVKSLNLIAEAAGVTDLALEIAAHIPRVVKLPDLAGIQVLLRLDWLTATANYLVNDPCALRKLVDDHLQVACRHVLSGIDTEAGNPERQKVV
jgi:hypothetical protein